MSDRFETGAPSTGTEIVAELRRLHTEGEAYLRSLPADVFVQPQGEKWSPADHVRHLAKSIRPVALALGLPRFLVWLRFGHASGASRSFMLMRETYCLPRRGRHRGTVRAFAAAPSPGSRGPPRQGARVLAGRGCRPVVADRGVGRIGADRYRLPHPALGKLTVREMLFFSLYHNAHHLNLLARRVR